MSSQAAVLAPPADMITLARLHAALDSVVETEQLLAAINDTTAFPHASAVRVAKLVSEARELLRTMLVRPTLR